LAVKAIVEDQLAMLESFPARELMKTFEPGMEELRMKMALLAALQARNKSV
jgi:hypothetical protein